jgi:hypothetical protein
MMQTNGVSNCAQNSMYRDKQLVSRATRSREDLKVATASHQLTSPLTGLSRRRGAGTHLVLAVAVASCWTTCHFERFLGGREFVVGEVRLRKRGSRRTVTQIRLPLAADWKSKILA